MTVFNIVCEAIADSPHRHDLWKLAQDITTAVDLSLGYIESEKPVKRGKGAKK